MRVRKAGKLLATDVTAARYPQDLGHFCEFPFLLDSRLPVVGHVADQGDQALCNNLGVEVPGVLFACLHSRNYHVVKSTDRIRHSKPHMQIMICLMSQVPHAVRYTLQLTCGVCRVLGSTHLI